jgi:hypothetical protein
VWQLKYIAKQLHNLFSQPYTKWLFIKRFHFTLGL